MQYSKSTQTLYASDSVDKHLYKWDLAKLSQKHLQGELLVGPTKINAYRVIEGTQTKPELIVLNYTVNHLAYMLLLNVS